MPVVATTPSLSSETKTQPSTWKMPLVVGAVSALIYLLTAAYGAVSGDVGGSHVLAWQLATTGDPTYTEGTYPPLDNHPLRDQWIQFSLTAGKSSLVFQVLSSRRFQPTGR